MSENANQPKRTASAAEMLSALNGIVSPVNTPTDPAAPAAPANPTAQANPTAPANPANPANQVAPANPANPAAPAAPVTVSTPFGVDTFGEPKAPVVLSSFADVQAFAKDVAGMELKDVKDLAPVIQEWVSFKKANDELATVQQKVQGYESVFKNLPEDVTLIVTAAIQGQDYKPLIDKLSQKNTLDLDKPFEAHDPIRLVNHYTGNTYTRETFEALEGNVKNALIDSAKIKYSTDKDEFVRTMNNAKASSQARSAAFTSSIETSIANLVAANPSMDKAVVDRVRQIMTMGFADALFSPDKTRYLPDAAEKIAMMEYGKQAIQAQRKTIGDLVQQYQNKGATAATEQILFRSDKPTMPSGAPVDPNLISTAVKQMTGFLSAK